MTFAEPSDLPTLLEDFLVGTTGVRSGERVAQVEELPTVHRRFIESSDKSQAWVARSTPEGMMAAWGYYDPVASRQLHQHVVYIEWMLADRVRHAGWWRADPRHTREWLGGRGTGPS